jgi:hypothetical protein
MRYGWVGQGGTSGSLFGRALVHFPYFPAELMPLDCAFSGTYKNPVNRVFLIPLKSHAPDQFNDNDWKYNRLPPCHCMKVSGVLESVKKDGHIPISRSKSETREGRIGDCERFDDAIIACC